MKKSDLKTGMRVKTRSGEIFLVIKDIDSQNYGHQDVAFVHDLGFMPGDSYDCELKCYKNKNFDIVEVFRLVDTSNREFLTGNILRLDHRYSIWRRQEPMKMTVSEIEKELGYPVEIIAEDVK